MRSDPFRLAAMADPVFNRHFRRRWAERPMTAAELEFAADLEAAHGNARRAELLSWQAHAVRLQNEVRP